MTLCCNSLAKIGAKNHDSFGSLCAAIVTACFSQGFLGRDALNSSVLDTTALSATPHCDS